MAEKDAWRGHGLLPRALLGHEEGSHPLAWTSLLKRCTIAWAWRYIFLKQKLKQTFKQKGNADYVIGTNSIQK